MLLRGRPNARLRGQQGFVTVQHVWVVATSLLLLTLVANVIVVQYAHAVVRTAVDEGARAGARVLDDPVTAVAVCRSAASAAREELLRGRLGDQVVITCVPEPGAMTARAAARLAAWLPGIPDWTVEAAAVVVQERAP